MPKREASAPVKGRTYSRRAASKEALKQMHLILDDEAETLEVRDDDVSTLITLIQCVLICVASPK